MCAKPNEIRVNAGFSPSVRFHVSSWADDANRSNQQVFQAGGGAVQMLGQNIAVVVQVRRCRCFHGNRVFPARDHHLSYTTLPVALPRRPARRPAQALTICRPAATTFSRLSRSPHGRLGSRRPALQSSVQCRRVSDLCRWVVARCRSHELCIARFRLSRAAKMVNAKNRTSNRWASPLVVIIIIILFIRLITIAVSNFPPKRMVCPVDHIGTYYALPARL